MSRATIVRYRTRPETADENERLIGAVFAELAERRPAGLAYQSFRLADGVSFVHVAVFEGDDNPLDDVLAFKEFVGGIAGRCDEPPAGTPGRVVGSYRPAP